MTYLIHLQPGVVIIVKMKARAGVISVPEFVQCDQAQSESRTGSNINRISALFVQSI